MHELSSKKLYILLHTIILVWQKSEQMNPTKEQRGIYLLYSIWDMVIQI